jgi:hypothetical protein
VIRQLRNRGGFALKGKIGAVMVDKNAPTFLLLSRTIYDSRVWRGCPQRLKLWIWLLGRARYQEEPIKFPQVTVKRGELVTSINEICDALAYCDGRKMVKPSRSTVGRMLDDFASAKDGEEPYIRKVRDTWGTHISILNYGKWQDFSTYKRDTCGTSVVQVRDECGTSADTIKQDKQDKQEDKQYNDTKRERAEKVFVWWNEDIAPKHNLPKATKLTTQRIKKICAMLDEGMGEFLDAMFDNMAKASHHLGNNNRGWKASLDWVLGNDKNGARNWLRLAEGALCMTNDIGKGGANARLAKETAGKFDGLG